MDQKMQVYKKINSAVEEKKVTSYDQELMNFLVTHKDLSNDKITNYYDSLQSTYSISKCYRFIRYLALGLDIEQIKVCEGYLVSLSGNTPDTKFTHCWMELSDSILDTSFIGKWEKETYYDLFQPEIKKEINLKEDENYQTYRQKNSKCFWKSKRRNALYRLVSILSKCFSNTIFTSSRMEASSRV